MSYLNPFSDKFILKDLLSGIGNILSFLNPFSDNFFGKKLVELLQDLLNFLFVPSEERINGLVNSVKCKFDFIESIKIAINSMNDLINSCGNSAVLSININATKYTEAANVTILDLSWYAPFKPYGDLIITGFVYAMFLFRLFARLPDIISGAGSTYNDVTAQVSDIDAYNRFGFGRSSSTIRRQDSKNGGIYRK